MNASTAVAVSVRHIRSQLCIRHLFVTRHVFQKRCRVWATQASIQMNVDKITGKNPNWINLYERLYRIKPRWQKWLIRFNLWAKRVNLSFSSMAGDPKIQVIPGECCGLCQLLIAWEQSEKSFSNGNCGLGWWVEKERISKNGNIFWELKILLMELGWMEALNGSLDINLRNLPFWSGVCSVKKKASLRGWFQIILESYF